MTDTLFAVQRLGMRGEGVAEGPNGLVYLPYALPDETVAAELDGEIGHVTGWSVRRSDRVAPICPHFGTCGGCAVQALPMPPYLAWKRDLVAAALAHAGVGVPVAPTVDAHGTGRRRVTFHARPERSRNVLRSPGARVGFMRARSHEIVSLTTCPVLEPRLAPALSAAQRIADATASREKPLDILVTASEAGLDVDLRGLGPLPAEWLATLTTIAADLDLARLSNHGSTVVERRPPTLRVGRVSVPLPAGAFLQATTAGEHALAGLVLEAVGASRKVVDLFCGVGTFALRLAEQASVLAYDLEEPAVAALARASRVGAAVRPVTATVRDLFRRPMGAEELAGVDAVVLDPPRAGASAQAEELGRSSVPTVVSVSCNPATFARDAALLVAGGYSLDAVTPVDQFRYSPHVEVVGVFRRSRARKAARRSLFG